MPKLDLVVDPSRPARLPARAARLFLGVVFFYASKWLVWDGSCEASAAAVAASRKSKAVLQRFPHAKSTLLRDEIAPREIA